MKMTHKIGISLIGLCALLLLGSPIYAGIWTTNGGGCVPDEASAGRINLYAGLAHKTDEVGPIVARCNIVDVQGDDVWKTLGITAIDPVGNAPETYNVRASLVSVSRSPVEVSEIISFDSDNSGDPSPDNYWAIGLPSEFTFDFAEYAYYLYVTVDRDDTAEFPQFLRAEISSREAPPENEAPEANFSFTTDNLTVDFEDLSTDSDGEVVAWSWNFGDGITSTEQNPSHTYDAPDTYTVTLTVTDDDGAESEPAEDSVAVAGFESICDDEEDNDSDGLTDCDDPDCADDSACDGKEGFLDRFCSLGKCETDNDLKQECISSTQTCLREADGIIQRNQCWGDAFFLCTGIQ